MTGKPTIIEIAREMQRLLDSPLPVGQYIPTLQAMFPTATQQDFERACDVTSDEFETFVGTAEEDIAEIYSEFYDAVKAGIETRDWAKMLDALHAVDAKRKALKLPSAEAIYPARPDKAKS